MGMETNALEFIVDKFQRLCTKDFTWIKSVSRDPNKENGLFYKTDFGDYQGEVTLEGDNLVFHIGDQQLVISAKTILGRSH
jgi:hypothetical protein